MITLFYNSEALFHCDEKGKTLVSNNIFYRVEAARKHFKNVGLDKDFLNQFIR
tara:strand:- start:2186 stop:2344 length:159 start_codon:yes stop_codon:yes gene_type:complete